MALLVSKMMMMMMIHLPVPTPPLVVIAVQAPGPAARSPFCSFLKVDSLVPLSVLVDPVIHNLTFRFT